MLDKLGLRSIEIIIAACVVVISIASLFVAVYQSMVMERTMKASVWPLVQYAHGNASEETLEPEISLEIHNRGIGPAHLRRVDIFWNGERYQRIQDFIIDCCVNAEDRDQGRVELRELLNGESFGYVTSPVNDVILSAGEEVEFFIFPGPTDPDVHAIWESVDDARWQISLRICYCSVFEDCWVLDTAQETRERTSLSQCLAQPEN